MANRAVIDLTVDPKSKKKTLTIRMESDPDALPHEHEQAHKDLVNKLLEKGMIGSGDDIVIERVKEEVPGGSQPQQQGQQQREAIAQK